MENYNYYLKLIESKNVRFTAPDGSYIQVKQDGVFYYGIFKPLEDKIKENRNEILAYLLSEKTIFGLSITRG